MKRPPRLDFAYDRAAHRRWTHIGLAALGLALGLQLGAALWRWQTLEAERAALQLQQQQFTGNRANSANNAELSADQLKTAVAAQAMLDSLAVPWDSLFSAIEAASTKGVLVESIQPRTNEASVSISVSSADFAGLAAFIGSLKQQAPLQQVMLESETMQDNGSNALRAVIRAHWRSTP